MEEKKAHCAKAKLQYDKNKTALCDTQCVVQPPSLQTQLETEYFKMKLEEKKKRKNEDREKTGKIITPECGYCRRHRK